MLGRIRVSPLSSLELLEMERPPSKIVKQDSLSIYESTLLKLKQGSHCSTSCKQEDSAQMDTCSTTIGEAVMSNPDSLADSIPSPSSNCQPKETKSIVYFFSKYKRSQQAQISSDREMTMAVETPVKAESAAPHGIAL